jgi:hypothetical protein
MAVPLLSSASSVMSANNIDNIEVVTNVSLLIEVGRLFSRHAGMPGRTPVELRREILRLQARFEKKKPKDEKRQEEFARYPFMWASSTEEDKEVFTPRSLARSNAFFKGKSAASASVDSDDNFMPPSKKGKPTSSSKGKASSSSKGKKKSV